ncbi:uncharacterized protein METZ01_LOCUS68202 [marine metagenome]|uniref:Uncharacterized protein n=1 Tax=marine metagenome TaxID=408172 RepID=A0A381TII9_9ZZZZ
MSPGLHANSAAEVGPRFLTVSRRRPGSQPATDIGTASHTSWPKPVGGCGSETITNCPGSGCSSQPLRGVSHNE